MEQRETARIFATYINLSITQRNIRFYIILFPSVIIFTSTDENPSASDVSLLAKQLLANVKIEWLFVGNLTEQVNERRLGDLRYTDLHESNLKRDRKPGTHTETRFNALATVDHYQHLKWQPLEWGNGKQFYLQVGAYPVCSLDKSFWHT